MRVYTFFVLMNSTTKWGFRGLGLTGLGLRSFLGFFLRDVILSYQKRDLW